MSCIRCTLAIEPERSRKGHDTCRTCGDIMAREAIHEKKSRVVVSTNKGGLVYESPQSIGQALLDAGRKTSNERMDGDVTRVFAPAPKPAAPKQRRAVGIYYKDGDKYVLREGDDPVKLGATRWVRTS